MMNDIEKSNEWYRVSRTSLYGSNEKPCEEAIILSNKRVMENEYWIVEVPNIHEFIDKYGKIIMFTVGDVVHIEIYDDYRE